MNFIRFAMKLYRIDVKNKPKMAALAINISSSTNVADKSWLMEKLEELNPTLV